MDTPIPPSPAAEAEREQARAARVRWEAEQLAAAQREIDAGLGISGDELDAWLEQSMATDEPVPMPVRRSGFAPR